MLNCPHCSGALYPELTLVRKDLTVAHGGKVVKLPNQRWELLRILASAPGQFLPVERVISDLWRGMIEPDTAYGVVRVQVHVLRGEIAPLGLRVLNVRERGYCLAFSASPVTSRIRVEAEKCAMV